MIEVELFEENILRNIGVQNYTDSLPLYHTMPYKSQPNKFLCHSLAVWVMNESSPPGYASTKIHATFDLE